MWRRTPEFCSAEPWIDLDLFRLGKEFHAQVRRFKLERSLECLLFKMEYRLEFFPCLGVGQVAHHATESLDHFRYCLGCLRSFGLVDEVVVDVDVRLMASS